MVAADFESELSSLLGITVAAGHSGLTRHADWGTYRASPCFGGDPCSVGKAHMRLI